MNLIELYHNYYKQSQSLRRTAKKFNISRSKLTNLFNTNGIPINKSCQDLYALNSNYFKRINSAKKAYWLGFIFADGHLI